MAVSTPRRRAPPLDETRLQELALTYVGRFATSRAKLQAYLKRKLRERGWEGANQPDLAGMAERFAELGYIDEAGLALSRARGLSARGYGKRRLLDTLRRDGIGEEESAEARALSSRESVASALRFAERRRIGPFATETVTDPRQRDKWIGALVRAGHSFSLARHIAAMAAGAEVDPEELAATHRLNDE